MLKKEFARVFEGVDAIATPTSPVPAFTIGEKSHDPLSMYLADIFTVPVNIVGVPAISIPSGKTIAGLPLGIQFIAPHTREDILFTIGKDFERLY
jgi:aspartyl-tRNA(Asn)/glutamyl-tRNA(Gln) amidotransferase subunit A